MNLQYFTQFRLNPMAFLLRLVPASARLLLLALSALVSVLLILVFRSGLETLEESLGALGWTLSPDTIVEERITLVVIDEKSVAEVGRWPWPRAKMAELVQAIDQAGAQLQIHDINYPESSAGDDQLLAALQTAGESSSGAVLAQLPVLLSSQPAQAGLMTHPLTGVSCAPGQKLGLASTQSYVASHSGFASIAKGHIAAIVANDGAVRQIPAVICVEGSAYPALSIAALLQLGGGSQWTATIEAGSSPLDSAFVLSLDAFPGLDIPLDDGGNLRISYANEPSVYRALSAVDVLNGTVDLGLLDNTVALLGVTATGTGDIVPTPYSGAALGVELQARLLSSLLDAEIPYTPRSSMGLLGLLSLAFAVALYLLSTIRGRLAAYGLPLATLLLPLLALSLHVQLLNIFNLWLGWIFPAIYGFCAASMLLLLEQSRVRTERSRVYGNLNSYLPGDIAKEIAYSLPSSSINARRCDVTLLNADLRNFSAFGEARPPEESAAVLHYFFTRATDIVEQHGGRVHEFKGDSVLAVWDGNDQQAAQQALKAGQAMQAALYHNFLPEHAPAGLEPMALGIGIEQGPVLIGSIGPSHRRSHVLLGDTVVITLRIQEMTAELAQPILVGECAARQLSAAKLESQGSYLLNGLTIPHILFAPAIPDDSKRSLAPAKPESPNLTLLTGGRQ